MQNMSAKEKELKLDNNEQRIQILDLEEQIEKLKNDKDYEKENIQEMNDLRWKLRDSEKESE